MPAWFEGGQTPLVQRLPKMRGFKKPFKLIHKFTPVNLAALEANTAITNEVTIESLMAAKLVNKGEKVKILANGDLTKKLSFTGISAISAAAKEKIEKAGGTIN